MFKRIVVIIIIVLIGMIILPSKFPLVDGYVIESKEGYLSILEGISDVEEESKVDFGYPMFIEIPSVGIALDVLEGQYNDETNEWNISDGYVYWANLSDLPSIDLGNSLFYSHNKWNGFYKLRNISEGDYIYLKTENGYTLNYRYVESLVVGPYDDSLFSWNDRNIITLLTCHGINSSERKLYIAEFIEYTKE